MSAVGADLGLHHPSAYRFLNASGCYTADGISDSEDFAKVVAAILLLLASDERHRRIFRGKRRRRTRATEPPSNPRTSPRAKRRRSDADTPLHAEGRNPGFKI